MPAHLIEWELEAGEGGEEHAGGGSCDLLHLAVDMQVKARGQNVDLLTDVTVTKFSAKKRSEFGPGAGPIWGFQAGTQTLHISLAYQLSSCPLGHQTYH